MAAIQNIQHPLIWLMIIICWSLHSCNHSRQNIEESAGRYLLRGDTITLANSNFLTSSIYLDTVIQQSVISALTATGTVRILPTSYAEVAPPFAGRVLKSYVTLGQKVKSGDPIFEISSSDYFETQKIYFDAKQELQQAEVNVKRQRDLWKHGVGIQREVEEAESLFTIKQLAFSNAESALKVFNVDPGHTTLGQPLRVLSPIGGRVVTNDIVTGQYVREDALPLAAIADLSKIGVSAQIKEKDIHKIRQQGEATIRLTASPHASFKGIIQHINDMFDEATRSVEVLIVCENPQQELKPGMFAEISFENKINGVILVPASSVFQKEQEQFVFVKIDDRRFVKRSIAVAETFNGDLMVTSGLSPGEIIVGQGGALMLRNH